MNSLCSNLKKAFLFTQSEIESAVSACRKMREDEEFKKEVRKKADKAVYIAATATTAIVGVVGAIALPGSALKCASVGLTAGTAVGAYRNHKNKAEDSIKDYVHVAKTAAVGTAIGGLAGTAITLAVPAAAGGAGEIIGGTGTANCVSFTGAGIYDGKTCKEWLAAEAVARAKGEWATADYCRKAAEWAAQRNTP